MGYLRGLWGCVLHSIPFTQSHLFLQKARDEEEEGKTLSFGHMWGKGMSANLIIQVIQMTG